MPPGLIAALTGLWQGRGKFLQEQSKPKKAETKKRNASRNE